MGDTKNQNIIELCAGYGGISMGIKRVIPNIRVRVYVEIEAYAVANLVEKIEAGKMDAAPIWTDIKTFPGKEFCRKIHGIIGGYPCQPFSTAGKRKGISDSRHLFPYILTILKSVKPVWCFFENVQGHLSLGYGEVYRSLRDLGYIVEAGIFSAAECGASHRRGRLFILAVREGVYGWGLSKREKEKQSKPRKSSKDMGNNRSKKSNRIPNGKRQKILPTGDTNKNVFTAKPGQRQYRFEKLRLKSRLGRTIYGASCRVDRIRMLGNGVVPDTAELAFRTLIEKVNKNLLIEKSKTESFG